MDKKIIFFLILFFLIIVGPFFVWFFYQNTSTTNTTNVSSSEEPALQDSSLPIGQKDSTPAPSSKNFSSIWKEYDTSGNKHIPANEHFSIFYYAPDNSYTIALLQKPLTSARTLAEQTFLSSLNISESEACNLTTVVSVSYYIDPNLSGRDLGLSFCPGSVALYKYNGL